MPSALLTALYNRDIEKADSIAAGLSELDVFESAAIGDAGRLAELIGRNPAAATAWSDDGFTPLHLAAFFDHPECVRALIAAGADVDAPAQNTMNVRPLHSAVTARSLTCVEILLAAGADANARQAAGFVPLHSAVHNGDSAIEAALLAGGADPTALSDDGRGIAALRKPD